MKSLLLASSLMFSVAAFAVDQNSTWGEINASYKTQVNAPEVGFAAGQATTFYSIFETCVDGDTIKTIEPKDVYSQINHGKGNIELVVVGQEVLSHPMTYSIQVPVGNHSEEKKTIEVTIPVNYNIDVFAAHTKNQEAQLMFTKSYSIPACK